MIFLLKLDNLGYRVGHDPRQSLERLRLRHLSSDLPVSQLLITLHIINVGDHLVGLIKKFGMASHNIFGDEFHLDDSLQCVVGDELVNHFLKVHQRCFIDPVELDVCWSNAVPLANKNLLKKINKNKKM